MKLNRRVAKFVLLLVALVALGVVISGCAFIKAGSLAVSQPGGVGTVRVHFALCNQPADESELDKCEPNASKEETNQYLLGIAVPPGSVPPETVTAVAVGGGAPIVFHRSAEVTAQIGALSGIEEGETKVPIWPPAGTEGVGYLSDPYVEETGTTRELTVDADFGLPVPADGGAFGGPFRTALAFGLREVSPTQPANRPVQCLGPATPPESDNLALCVPTGFEAQAGTSDLRIAAPKKATPVFVGGKAPVKFGLAFASTVGALPTFAMKATTTLKGGKASVANPTFVPGNVDPSTHRSPAANSTATVTVPKKAKPGTYEVVLTATAPQGGTVTQVAKLKVTKPKLKLGAAKLNPVKGTATLEVKVPGAGSVTVSGKDVVKTKRSAKGAKKLKLTIRPRGNAKTALLQTGSAKVKAKLTFKPKSGNSVAKTKTIVLQLG